MSQHMMQPVTSGESLPPGLKLTGAAMSALGFELQLRRHHPRAQYDEATLWARRHNEPFKHWWPATNLAQAVALLDIADGTLVVREYEIKAAWFKAEEDAHPLVFECERGEGDPILMDVCGCILNALALAAPPAYSLSR